MKKMRVIGLLVVWLMVLSLLSSPILAQNGRKIINFNSG